MSETKSILLSSAMRYGLSLGIYWVIKYLFFILSVSMPFFSFVYWGMSLAVPFIAYFLTKRYRADIGGNISFLHAWQFGVSIYFFAALIVSLMHYVFYRYIADPSLLSNTIQQTLILLKEMKAGEDVINSVSQLQLTPIHMAVQGIFNNVFYGIVLSIPVAAIVCRNNVTGRI